MAKEAEDEKEKWKWKQILFILLTSRSRTKKKKKQHFPDTTELLQSHPSTTKWCWQKGHHCRYSRANLYGIKKTHSAKDSSIHWMELCGPLIWVEWQISQSVSWSVRLSVQQFIQMKQPEWMNGTENIAEFSTICSTSNYCFPTRYHHPLLGDHME